MPGLEELIKIAQSLAENQLWDEKALEVNTRILERDEENQGAYTRLARYYFEKKDYETAKSLYENVLQFAPENRIAKSKLIEIKGLYKEKEEQEKIEEIKKINDYRKVLNMGMSFKRLGLNVFTIACFNRVLELQPENEYAKISLAATYRNAGEPEEAKKIYKDLLKKDRNSIVLVGLAAVYKDLKEYEKSERLYLEVLSKEPNNIYASNGFRALNACRDDNQKK